MEFSFLIPDLCEDEFPGREVTSPLDLFLYLLFIKFNDYRDLHIYFVVFVYSY